MSARAAAHVAVAELLAEYFARVDRIIDRPPADTFTVHGRMRLGSLSCDGRAEIDYYFRGRKAEEQVSHRKTRHVMSNMVVERLEGAECRVRLQCLVFAAVGDFPLPSAVPATIADFSANCIFADGAWLLGELYGRTTFSGANAAAFAV